jgi:tetratricopeptide (TPR) repeat protein
MRFFLLLNRYIPSLTIFCSLLLLYACASVQYQRDLADYQEELQELEAKLSVEPDNPEVLRDIGVIYFETANYLEAKEYLQKAHTNDSGDAKTMLYLGMAMEFRGETTAAREVQSNYVDVSRLSPYRKIMQGRYIRLSRQITQQEFQDLIAREQEFGDERLDEAAVAVFPLDYLGSDENYNTLGRGISQMLITDLGKVQSLTVLERLKMQVLVQELELGQTKYVDEQTAPRLGKLLGAAQIVSGSFDVIDESNLQIDAMSWDVSAGTSPESVLESGELNNMFLMEKTIVFNLLDKMGIELTNEERTDIQRIPTENLQSFFAYCKGLEREDAGDFPGAASFFNQATELDPNFEQAQTELDANESAMETPATPDEAIAQVARIEGRDPNAAPASGGSLLDNRLQSLNNNLGTNFVPGQDSRKSVEEAAGSTAISDELPEPPPPPPAN